MIPINSPAPGFHVRKWHVILLVILCLPVFGTLGIASYFQLGSETRALRASVMANVKGEWHKKFAGNVGGFTTALVRVGSLFFRMPPEPRAAINSLRGGECGVYELEREPAAINRAAILLAADKAMAARGWARVVGVVQADSLVAVYMPRRGMSPKSITAAVLVLNDRELVVAQARGNVKPLLQIAENRLRTKLPWSRNPNSETIQILSAR